MHVVAFLVLEPFLIFMRWGFSLARHGQCNKILIEAVDLA